MEHITDADYVHPKEVCKDFEVKNLDELHDLYVQSDTILIADLFDNHRNIFLETYGLHPDSSFSSAPGLAWQTALKNTKVK